MLEPKIASIKQLRAHRGQTKNYRRIDVIGIVAKISPLYVRAHSFVPVKIG